ncbi:MAG: hypothetical protein ACFB0D_19285 [Phormidesmis sp.]
MASSHLEKDIYLELQQGKFCHVLEPAASIRTLLSQDICRGMCDRGYRTVSIGDAPNQDSPSQDSAHQTWDKHIILSIWQGLHPGSSAWLSQWLITTSHLSARQRLMRFADELLLSDLCEGPLLICLCNIDGLMTQSLAIETLLAWISHCYELRDTYLTYRHLSIVAFGTVSFQPQSLCLQQSIKTQPTKQPKHPAIPI